MLERFAVKQTTPEIVESVEKAMEENDSKYSLGDTNSYEWEFDVIDLDEIEVDENAFTAKSNVALYERRVAMERAQLTVGEGWPLIVIGENNHLVEGYVRFQMLNEQFEPDEIAVYRGYPQDEQSVDHKIIDQLEA